MPPWRKASELTLREQKRREQNRLAQERYVARQLQRGLVQQPDYVPLETRPEFKELGRAFDYVPSLTFDQTVGSLRDAKGQYGSPVKFVAKAEGRPFVSKREQKRLAAKRLSED